MTHIQYQSGLFSSTAPVSTTWILLMPLISLLYISNVVQVDWWRLPVERSVGGGCGDGYWAVSEPVVDGASSDRLLRSQWTNCCGRGGGGVQVFFGAHHTHTLSLLQSLLSPTREYLPLLSSHSHRLSLSLSLSPTLCLSLSLCVSLAVRQSLSY